MKNLKCPDISIIRLSVYSRYLAKLAQNGFVTISSKKIAEDIGINPAQVRRDLSYFGEFGTRGRGYNVIDLNNHILRILGLTNRWPVVLVGAGNLGVALCLYKGFTERGFHMVGVFDNDPDKIGRTLGELKVLPLEQLDAVIHKEDAKIGIIAVPENSAQDTVNLLTGSGIKAILNFAPHATLTVPEGVEVRTVDLTTNLEVLSFKLSL